MSAILDRPSQGLKIRRALRYRALSDIAAPTSYATASTDQDLIPDQSFTVQGGNSVVLIGVSVGMLMVGTNQHIFYSWLKVDGTKYRLSGTIARPEVFYQNPFQSQGFVALTGLSPGSHTVRIGVWGSGTASYYLRCGTVPTVEGVTIDAIEVQGRTGPARRSRDRSPRIRLAYTQASDVSVTGASGWQNVGSSQSFVVSGRRSLILVGFRAGHVHYPAGATSTLIRSRFVVDGTTGYALGGALPYTTVIGPNDYASIFRGGALACLSGLAPGSHTLQLQAYLTNTTDTCAFSVASSPTLYHLNYDVVEIPL